MNSAPDSTPPEDRAKEGHPFIWGMIVGFVGAIAIVLTLLQINDGFRVLFGSQTAQVNYHRIDRGEDTPDTSIRKYADYVSAISGMTVFGATSDRSFGAWIAAVETVVQRGRSLRDEVGDAISQEVVAVLGQLDVLNGTMISFARDKNANSRRINEGDFNGDTTFTKANDIRIAMDTLAALLEACRRAG